MNKKGFTLIELLVVIAIIGLLSTLAVVSLNNARAKARDARRTSDLKALQSAMELYIADNNDAVFAVQATWDAMAGATYLGPYLPSGMPTDPGSNDYRLCTNAATGKYLIEADLENDATAPGITSVGTWVAADCRDSADGNSTAPTCSAATDFCLGYPDKT